MGEVQGGHTHVHADCHVSVHERAQGSVKWWAWTTNTWTIEWIIAAVAPIGHMRNYQLMDCLYTFPQIRYNGIQACYFVGYWTRPFQGTHNWIIYGLGCVLPHLEGYISEDASSSMSVQDGHLVCACLANTLHTVGHIHNMYINNSVLRSQWIRGSKAPFGSLHKHAFGRAVCPSRTDFLCAG